MGLIAYSLDLVARFVQGHAPLQLLEASLERIAGQDSTVIFFRTFRVGHRTMSTVVSLQSMQWH